MIIDGKKIASEIKSDLRKKLSGKKLTVGLIVVGSDTVTDKFVSMKQKTADDLGVDLRVFEYDESISKEDLIDEVKLISSRGDISGLVIQLPLPTHLKDETDSILELVPPAKDIDALGKETRVSAPVAVAVREILARSGVELKGKNIVVVGRGRLVGRPVAVSLATAGGNVNDFDENSPGLKEALKNADIVVSGAGDPHFIKPNMIKDGVVLIDAGTSESAGRVVGDIDPACAEKASIFSPVPGGVGPVALSCLFKNLAELQNI